jgi:hypothetical protein
MYISIITITVVLIALFSIYNKIENYLPAHSLCNNYRWDYLPEEFQLIMKIGIWCKKQIEDKTALGMQIANGFIKYEKNRIKRKKSNSKLF